MSVASDESQIQMIAAQWEDAWNTHDMTALRNLVTEDTDFVNVGAKHWKGRKEFEEQHTARLGQFMGSRWATKLVTVQFLKPHIGLVHVNWELKGDTDPNGTVRPPREGTFTWIVTKKDGLWMIRAAQNTNASHLPLLASK